jgi:acetyl-CoA/propionyl-CoA carboxylase biotin carboxyl carrier protein
MITRLLIANRGEIAVRIIRAARELGIETVAVYSDADAGSVHAWSADRAIGLGSSNPRESYLSIPTLIDAALTAGADAVHPGYGFLSESHEFSGACERAGLIFVGPPTASIERMGSKIRARALMASAGVPIVPGQVPPDQTDAGLVRAIHAVGFPALVKPSEGGGGKGMHRVEGPKEAVAEVQAARREAAAAFGDGTLYVEKLIERPHHIEVQVFGDALGQIVHLFERDCSLQRRHQKVIEESPSPGIDGVLRARMVEAAVRAARAAGYRNAGTIEFLVDLSRGIDAAEFFFLEMNTRLQVEHTVTEQVTGIDLVHAQLRVASGERLPWSQADLTQRGHAIEARVYAEDPGRGFLPQSGRLLLYREPQMPGVRIDSGVVEGDEISVHYDPLLAKVIAAGESRSVAIARLIVALRAFPILGIRTNVPFLLSVLEHPQFRAGTFDTTFLETMGTGPGPHLELSERRSIPDFVAKAFDTHRALGRPSASHGPAAIDPWSRK